jgi:hypothetical protein
MLTSLRRKGDRLDPRQDFGSGVVVLGRVDWLGGRVPSLGGLQLLHLNRLSVA